MKGIDFKPSGIRNTVFIVPCILSFFINSAFAQISKEGSRDTLYIKDYSDLLGLRIYSNTKWNTLDIIKDKQRLTLQPNSPTAIGVGFNYKEYGLAIAFGIPKSEESKTKYGTTKRLDIQINKIGEKVGIDGFAQFYKGYYNINPDDFLDWETDAYPQLPEMKVISVGLNGFYIFNSDQFSFKAAFVRNQVQLKSAGSFTVGLFGRFDMADTESGFIPNELPDSIANQFDLKSFSTLAVGVTAGYLYNWVISKNFFINVGLTPGFGYERIQLETLESDISVENAPAVQLAARAALAYESKHFYAGISGVIIWRNFEYKGYDLDLSTEQFKIFIGKRFNISK